MPSTKTILRVLLSSPGDVGEERDAAEAAVTEANRILSRTSSILFELVRWESHSRPGVGDDAQDVLNKQFAEDYDIFVGILWARLGTPTKRDTSGTSEEFHKALSKHQAAPEAMRLMLYRKTEPVDPSSVDIEQLRAVQEFFESTKADGVLFQKFGNTTEFENLLRLHLVEEAHSFGRDWGKKGDASEVRAAPSTSFEGPSDVSSPNMDEVEVGVLDLLTDTHDGIGRASESLEIVTNAMRQLGERVQERGRSVRNGDQSPARLRHFGNSVADDFDEFAGRAEVEFVTFSKSQTTAFAAFKDMLPLLSDFDYPGMGASLARLQGQLEESIDATTGAIEAIDEFDAGIGSLPRLTTQFNRARRRTLAIVSRYREELIARNRAVESIIRVLKQIQDKS